VGAFARGCLLSRHSGSAAQKLDLVGGRAGRLRPLKQAVLPGHLRLQPIEKGRSREGQRRARERRSDEGQINFATYDGLYPVYTEYNVGNYARSFQLSSDIDQDRISAEFKDGVVMLTLPKAAKPKPRKINVT
jgi:hypothetical protein